MSRVLCNGRFFALVSLLVLFAVCVLGLVLFSHIGAIWHTTNGTLAFGPDILSRWPN